MTNYDIAQMTEGQKEILFAGMKLEQQRTIELLESGKHVLQLDIAPNGKWKQRCRCGFYGIFNDHLAKLIKGENK